MINMKVIIMLMISYNDAQSSGQRMVFQNGKWKISGEILAIINNDSLSILKTTRPF